MLIDTKNTRGKELVVLGLGIIKTTYDVRPKQTTAYRRLIDLLNYNFLSEAGMICGPIHLGRMAYIYIYVHNLQCINYKVVFKKLFNS